MVEEIVLLNTSVFLFFLENQKNLEVRLQDDKHSQLAVLHKP